MRQFFIFLLWGLICLAIGLGTGLWLGLHSTQVPVVQQGLSLLKQQSWSRELVAQQDNSPIELYNYPTIKWRAKPMPNPAGAIAQLWTKYEAAGKQSDPGTVKYQLILYKAPNTQQCQVLLLDADGFKQHQFQVSDFHPMPGTPDILEARDSYSSSEDDYKKVRDYAVN